MHIARTGILRIVTMCKQRHCYTVSARWNKKKMHFIKCIIEISAAALMRLTMHKIYSCVLVDIYIYPCTLITRAWEDIGAVYKYNIMQFFHIIIGSVGEVKLLNLFH